MRDDLKQAVELVRSGLTYKEAARQLGMTTGQISGACYRAGLKRGGELGFHAMFRNPVTRKKIIAGQRKSWADPATRKYRIERMRLGWARRRERLQREAARA
jgi:hypothetical protein